MSESNLVQDQNRREFEEYKLASSLPDVLVIYGKPKVPAGAVGPDPSVFTTVDIDSNRWVMERTWFTTPTRIHGILHLQTLSQLFFLGYKCSKCDRVYLVPDAVKDDSDVAYFVRHACHE